MIAIIALAVGNMITGESIADTDDSNSANSNKSYATDADRAAHAQLIARLIEDLGSDLYRVREAAHQKLIDLATPLDLPALKAAAKSDDLEVAVRAEGILRELAQRNYNVCVDAMGKAIYKANVEITWKGGESESHVTNMLGCISLPNAPDRRNARVRFSHPKYGTAEGKLYSPGSKGILRIPLVNKKSEAYKRALKGVVIGPDGRGIEGARVTSKIVRTPGEGLIQYVYNLAAVITDKNGHFSIYVPDLHPKKKRGKLIPVNSHYLITVVPPAGDDLFPVAGRYINTKLAEVALRRPEKFHRFKFESMSGGFVTDPKALVHLSVSYVQPNKGGSVGLDRRYALKGGKLLEGTYIGWDGHKKFLPLHVTKDSPTELIFRTPPPVTFHGKVIDGITGKPIAGAFVMGYSGLAHNNLALLTDDQWKDLQVLSSNPKMDDPALAPLKRMYSFSALVRTDSEGRYQITQQSDEKFHSMLAFAKDSIPYTHYAFRLPKPDDKNQTPVPDMQLFPAARVIVEPVFSGTTYLSVSPKWIIDRKGQPDWIKKFRAAKTRNAKFAYVHWLKLNKHQAIYVPADLKLKLRLETPYNDELADAKLTKTIKLAQGKELSLGKISFTSAIAISVQVVDSAGKAVEGVAVRRMYKGSNSWSLAHNTDAKGMAYFHAKPNSSGKFGVTEIWKAKQYDDGPEPVAQFKVDSKAATSKPHRITLTDKQVQKLFSAGKAR